MSSTARVAGTCWLMETTYFLVVLVNPIFQAFSSIVCVLISSLLEGLYTEHNSTALKGVSQKNTSHGSPFPSERSSLLRLTPRHSSMHAKPKRATSYLH